MDRRRLASFCASEKRSRHQETCSRIRILNVGCSGVTSARVKSQQCYTATAWHRSVVMQDFFSLSFHSPCASCTYIVCNCRIPQQCLAKLGSATHAMARPSRQNLSRAQEQSTLRAFVFYYCVAFYMREYDVQALPIHAALCMRLLGVSYNIYVLCTTSRASSLFSNP